MKKCSCVEVFLCYYYECNEKNVFIKKEGARFGVI